MNASAIIQDYYGTSNFIEQNQDKEITIFIVDDNKVYLNLLKNSLKRKNFSVFAFTTGEECMDYLELKPELIILDYHLDGVNPYAQKGDKISYLIKKKLPETEIILMSSDRKFKFISSINFSKKLMFKDEKALQKINKNVGEVLGKTKKTKAMQNKTVLNTIAIVALLVVVVLLTYYII